MQTEPIEALRGAPSPLGRGWAVAGLLAGVAGFAAMQVEAGLAPTDMAAMASAPLLVENYLRHGPGAFALVLALFVKRRGRGRHQRAAARRRGDEVRLQVVDDGVGIDPDCRPGVGLRAMRERAAELGGTAGIGAGAAGGTVVEVTVPVAHSPAHAANEAAASEGVR